MSMGASREPFRGSMPWPGEGIARRKLSERGLYALTLAWKSSRPVRAASEVGKEENMVRCRLRKQWFSSPTIVSHVRFNSQPGTKFTNSLRCALHELWSHIDC